MMNSYRSFNAVAHTKSLFDNKSFSEDTTDYFIAIYLKKNSQEAELSLLLLFE